MFNTIVMSKKLYRTLILTLLFALTVICWGNSLLIFAKANLANFLISYSWENTLHDQQIHTPWTWADTWPVGKLYFPKQRKTLYVLSGAHGSAMAFGPGLMDGTASPGEQGTMVIGGHRDTHFAFLKNIKMGEIFLLQSKNKKWEYYRFEKSHIMDVRHGPWYIDKKKNEVHLITCYPFDALVPGGPLRLVTIATPIFSGGSNTNKALERKNTDRMASNVDRGEEKNIVNF